MTINEITKIATERADRHEIEEANLYGGLSKTYSYSRIKNAEISSFIAGVEYAKENQSSPWINAKNNLPDDDTELYLIYCEAYNKNDIENKHYEIYLANFDRETSLWVNVESYNNYFFDVLYYMPIPKLPEMPKSVE